MKERSSFMKRIFVLGVTLFLTSCCMYRVDTVTVFYLPLSVVTYFPVTEQDISCRYETKYSTADNHKASELYGIIFSGNKTSDKFEKLQVRAKAVFENAIVFIDANGVFEYGGSTYKINVDDFKVFMENNALYIHRNLYSEKGCNYPD